MTRRDPGAATGQPIDTTRPAGCGCGHIHGVHEAKPGRRGRCQAATPNPCACRNYQPPDLP